MSVPATNTWPELTSSRPLRQFRRVVLPQPEGPMMATISPFSTASETPLSAWYLE